MAKLKIDENLATIQKTIEAAAGEVVHNTRAEREKITQRKPDNVRRREEAAERCTEVIKRGVLKKHARKATTEHLVKCSLAPGERQVRGKPLSELYANGDVTENVEERQQQLERQCGEVYTDQEETREQQEKRMKYFKKQGHRQSTEDGRRAEITVDLVLKARAKMSDNQGNGPEDTVASEMIKQLPLENININTKCLQERFMGHMEAQSSWKIVRLVFFRKPDAEPKKGIRSYTAIALTSVMSKWYVSRIIVRLEQRREPENWKKLHVGRINGISCYTVSPSGRLEYGAWVVFASLQISQLSFSGKRVNMWCMPVGLIVFVFRAILRKKEDRLTLLLRTSLPYHQV